MSDTHSLPSQDEDLSDNGLTTDYMVRITSYGKFTYEQLQSFIKDEYVICRYVIGREVDTGNEHFHMVLTTDITISLDDVKDIIRAFIVPLWADPITAKCPRGFGNKQYNCQVVKDKDLAVSYTVKLAEFCYEGYSEEYISHRVADSFLKKKPNNFKKEYLDLCTRFKDSNMDIREFMIEYVRLKAQYGQQVRMNDAYAYGLSNMIARDPSQAEEEVESYLYKK